MELRIREVDFKAGERSKGSNGGVAVGLPHRSSPVFKQTHINQEQVKMVEVRIQASEAKGPFSRREEGWELGEERISKRRGASTSGFTYAAQ